MILVPARWPRTAECSAKHPRHEVARRKSLNSRTPDHQ